jgi:HAD superfamily hydrolase (TIGR01484 family)
MTAPLPLADAPADQLRAATRLYFDVDDTLTFEGLLPPTAILALHRAKDAGLSLVAVTGRSAAWGEMMFRVFPLDAVIAETGAVCLFTTAAGTADVLHAEPDEATRRGNAERRERVARRVLASVPAARLALDNIGRQYDTAFDLIEDGPLVEEKDAARIRAILDDEGITWAQSSVHINAWIGHFDKASMVDRYLREVEQTSLEEAAATLVYAGDSTNDGAMFCRTPLSVGVANIAPHLDKLAANGQAPAFITEGKGGFGFAELVDRLLDARGA